MIDRYYAVQGIDFEWDVGKAANNQIKHGISFESACEPFFDPFVALLDDEVVSGEVRYTAVCMTTTWQLLYITYVWRGDNVRLISARIATVHERKSYETR